MSLTGRPKQGLDMELKEVQSDLFSLTKLYGLLQICKDSPHTISRILDERTRLLLKNLLDDAMDKLLIIHSKIIAAAKSGVFNKHNPSSSTISKTLEDKLEPSDTAKLLTDSSLVPYRTLVNGDSNLESKRLLREAEQSTVKPTAIQEAGSTLLRVDSVSSKADNRPKRCRICQRSKSMNAVVNSRYDQSNDANRKDLRPFEKDNEAHIPAAVVEKLQRKPSIARSVDIILASSGTRTVENSRKPENNKPLRSNNVNRKELEGPIENNKVLVPARVVEKRRHKPSNTRSIVPVSDYPESRTAKNNRKAKEIASGFFRKLLNPVKEKEHSSLCNNSRQGSSSESGREIPKNMNKRLKLKDVVQRIESVIGAASRNNGRAKALGYRITPTGGNNHFSAKKTITKSWPSTPSQKRVASRRALTKPALPYYYVDDNDGDDDARSWSNEKNHTVRSSSLEASEDELAHSSLQSDPGSPFVTSPSQRQISTSSHSLSRSNSSSVPETSADDSYISSSTRNTTPASSTTSRTYSYPYTYPSMKNPRITTGPGKLHRLIQKLAVTLLHRHSNKHQQNKSNWKNLHQMVKRKSNKKKDEKKEVKELEYEKKPIEELEHENKTAEEQGQAVAVSKNNEKGNQVALFGSLVKGLMRHVKDSKSRKVATNGSGRSWRRSQHHTDLVKPKSGRLKIGFRTNKPKLRVIQLPY